MFYVRFISMQAVVKNATNEASKPKINLKSAGRFFSLLAANGTHALKKEAIVPRLQNTDKSQKLENAPQKKPEGEGVRLKHCIAVVSAWPLPLPFRAISGVGTKKSAMFPASLYSRELSFQ